MVCRVPRYACPVRILAAVFTLIFIADARGDDVNLIPGSTFKQAIGGRV